MSSMRTIGIITTVVVVWILVMTILKLIFKKCNKNEAVKIFDKLSLVGLIKPKQEYSTHDERAAHEREIIRKYGEVTNMFR